MLRRIRECNRKLNAEIQELDRQIKAKYEPYREVLGRLSEIPGVQDRTCEDLMLRLVLTCQSFSRQRICVHGRRCARATMRVQVKKEWQDQQGQQVSQGCADRGCMGSITHERHVLQRTVRQACRTQGREEGAPRRGTLHPKGHTLYALHRCEIPRLRRDVCSREDREETQGLPQDGAEEARLRGGPYKKKED